MKPARRTRAKILSLLTISAAALGISTALPTTAQAAPGNAVIVGDSLPANPTVEDWVGSKIPGELARIATPNARINGAGCSTDFRFSDAYGRAAGKPADNYTCPGASFTSGGIHINALLDAAARQGSLNHETADVVIFAGANDTYSRVGKQDLPSIERDLYNAIRGTIAKARHYAPNARIKVVGSPHIANAIGQVCLINVVPNAPLPIPVGLVNDLEFHLQMAQVNASRDERAVFVDTKPVTDGHEMCSNDRWIAGVVDTTAQTPHNLMLHMTNAGLDAVAGAAARA